MFVIYDGSPYWVSIHPRQNFSREKSFLSSISCVLYHYHCHVDKKLRRRKNSFFKIKATGPGVVYFVWKNVSCTYFLFNRALSSLRFWNSIIPFLTTFEKKNQNQELSLMLYCKEHLALNDLSIGSTETK